MRPITLPSHLQPDSRTRREVAFRQDLCPKSPRKQTFDEADTPMNHPPPLIPRLIDTLSPTTAPPPAHRSMEKPPRLMSAVAAKPDRWPPFGPGRTTRRRAETHRSLTAA